MVSSRISTATLIVVLLSFTGCVQRQGRNTDCKWPGESDAKALRPDRASDARHLRADVEFAEELSVENMDANYGPRSRYFQSHLVANQHRNACLGNLIQQIADSHNVSPETLAQFAGRRSVAIDAGVNLPYILLYVLLATIAAGKLRRRYTLEDGWATPLTMTLLSSLAFGFGGLLLGQQWSIIAENIRTGSGHLSFRLQRLPWEQHPTSLFLLCVVLFWWVAAAGYRGLLSKSRLGAIR